ncbi:MAG: hypothetical protein FWG62_08355 [Proteobacteria bacterium]|nr:hypothetical protein [Pseudomonadota bacterium]
MAIHIYETEDLFHWWPIGAGMTGVDAINTNDSSLFHVETPPRFTLINGVSLQAGSTAGSRDITRQTGAICGDGVGDFKDSPKLPVLLGDQERQPGHVRPLDQGEYTTATRAIHPYPPGQRQSPSRGASASGGVGAWQKRMRVFGFEQGAASPDA